MYNQRDWPTVRLHKRRKSGGHCIDIGQCQAPGSSMDFGR